MAAFIAVFISGTAFLVAVAALARAVSDHFKYQRLIKKLQQRVLEAQKMLQQRGNLASEIAHEIKNPITAILCSAETFDLLVGPQLDQNNRDSLRYIKEYGDQVLRLVSDFIDVSRAESGNLQSMPQPVEIESVADSILGLLRSKAQSGGIALQCVCPEKDLKVLVDPKHLKQILFNLVHNAIKFTPRGGEVKVVAVEDFPNPYVRVAVNDNGAGIPAEEIDRLFDPYARFEGNQPALEAGVGLGLALCKMLVEMAGGSITVTSRVGIGSSFEVRLPKYINDADDFTDASRDSSELEGSTRPLVGQRFLIIDEDSGAREAVARLIEAWGGMVDRVSQATEAIQALADKNYDAVMIDEDIEGSAAALVQMLAEEETDSPSILITSRAEEGSQTDIALADRRISKPLNGRVLLESLLSCRKRQITH